MHAPAPVLAEQDIVVNGVTIPARDIAAEMQHHPATDAATAWRDAARALVIRRLLLDAAAEAAPEAEEDEAIAALLAREIQVPEPDEAAGRRWLAAHGERFGTPESWEASHILIAADPAEQAERAEARRRAEELLAQVLAEPTRMTELAMRHSACPSRDQGGHLGRIERGSTVPEFETFLAGLAPGQVCPSVVPSRYGMHVLHLHAHTPPQSPAFEEVRELVLRDLRDAGWHAAVRTYLAGLAARARIEGFELDPGGDMPVTGPS